VQDQQVRPATGRNRVSRTLVVAELYKQCRVIKLLDDGPDLPAREPSRGKVRQQRHDVQSRRRFVLFCRHHSTQQVTNLGEYSPVRTIQTDRTTALFSLSPDGRIEAPMRSPVGPHVENGLGGSCGFEQHIAQP